MSTVLMQTVLYHFLRSSSLDQFLKSESETLISSLMSYHLIKKSVFMSDILVSVISHTDLILNSQAWSITEKTVSKKRAAMKMITHFMIKWINKVKWEQDQINVYMKVTIRFSKDWQLINVDFLSRCDDLYTQFMNQITIYCMKVEVQHSQHHIKKINKPAS